MLRLQVTPAEGEPFDHLVEGDALVIGRSTRCDLSISDRFLSRQHVRLYREGEVWHVADLGSRNGTFVNGDRVEGPCAVHPGDVIAISASLVKLLRELGPEASTGGFEITTSSDVYYRPASDVLLQTRTPPPIGSSREHDALRTYAERLAILNEVHQALARSVALEELVELILDRVFEHLRPEHGAIFLQSPEGSFHRAASRSVANATGELVYSESLIREVAEKGMAALVADARTDGRFSAAHSLLDAGVRSLLAAPLLDQEKVVGLLVLSSNAAIRQFSEEDLELLVTLASVAAIRVRNIALTEQAAERQRFDDQLALARRIQVALLPETLPEIPGYRLYGGTTPSWVVSGDFYQVVEREDGRECVLLLADVSGKGVAASLLTGYLEALTSAAIELGLEPHEIFAQVSRPFCRRTPANRFATVFLAILDCETGRVRYANAGHEPACLIRTTGAVEWLGTTGLPLGLLSDAEYTGREAALEPGDTLVIYSDGFTEAENPDEEQFGSQRLSEVLVRSHTRGPEELAAAVEDELSGFADGTPDVDDRTMVILRRLDPES